MNDSRDEFDIQCEKWKTEPLEQETVEAPGWLLALAVWIIFLLGVAVGHVATK